MRDFFSFASMCLPICPGEFATFLFSSCFAIAAAFSRSCSAARVSLNLAQRLVARHCHDFVRATSSFRETPRGDLPKTMSLAVRRQSGFANCVRHELPQSP